MPFRFHTSLRTRYVSSFTWMHICSITFISVIFLVMGWLLYIKNPIDQQVLNQEHDLASLQKKIDMLQAGKDAFDQAVKQEQRAQQELSRLIKDLQPIRVQLDSLMNLLQQNNLTCRAMTPTLQEGVLGQFFVGYCIQATAYGSFQAIHQFLNDLSTNQQFVTVWMSVQKKRKRCLELKLYCKVLAQAEERQ